VTPYEVGLPGHVQRAADGSWEDDPLINGRALRLRAPEGPGPVRLLGLLARRRPSNVLTHAREVLPSLPLYGVMGGLHLSGVTGEDHPGHGRRAECASA